MAYDGLHDLHHRQRPFYPAGFAGYIALSVMNSRRVHQVMKESFPPFDAAAHEWVNAQETDGAKLDVLHSVLLANIDAPEVLIEVHRKLGALLPLSEAAAFIGKHIGEGQIRVADRGFLL
jgi:hypothetical protein